MQQRGGERRESALDALEFHASQAEPAADHSRFTGAAPASIAIGVLNEHSPTTPLPILPQVGPPPQHTLSTLSCHSSHTLSTDEVRTLMSRPP